MKWTATFLTPPDFSVMQVAFEYKIFQHVPAYAVVGKRETRRNLFYFSKGISIV